MLFHLLKQGHAMCERALAPAFTAARVTGAHAADSTTPLLPPAAFAAAATSPAVTSPHLLLLLLPIRLLLAAAAAHCMCHSCRS